MISSLSGRVAALLAAAAILVVLLVGWLLLVSPQRGKAAELSGQIDQTQAQVASTQAYVSDPETHRSIHDLQRLRKVLPDDSRMSQILRQLSAAAGAARVSVIGVTPQAPISASGGQALPIALTAEGHYFGISKFLHILRRQAFVRGTAVHGSGRLYSVDGIQFASGTSSGSATGGSSSGSGNTGVISATISLNAFVYGSGVAVVPSSDASASGGTATTTTTSTSSSAAAPAPIP